MYHVLRLHCNSDGEIWSFNHCDGTYTLEEAKECLKILEASNKDKDEDGYYDKYVVSKDLPMSSLK